LGATIFAATFVLFGTAEVNILSGVQISQVGSIVLGFTQLLCADHDGRLDRRDWLGLVCGLGSIMSSGFGPPMVAIVGLATICRRGWRPATFHTIPLAAVYIGWWMWSDIVARKDQKFPPLEIIVQWVAHGESGVLLALGGNTIFAVALGALLLAGLILAWVPFSLPMLRQRASLPSAMFVGALVLQAVICTERWPLLWVLGLDAARAGRYIAVCAALSLPIFAVAGDALVRRWQWIMPVICVILLFGIAVNITRFGNDPLLSSQAFTEFRTTMLAVAYSPLAEEAPGNLIPELNGFFGGNLDMDFLLEARNLGRLPPPPLMTPALESQTELRLSAQQLAMPVPPALSCKVYSEPIKLNPRVGDMYGFKSPIRIALGESGAPLDYIPGLGGVRVIRILRPGLTFHFFPKPPSNSFRLCY
jgi:hypothetical protein